MGQTRNHLLLVVSDNVRGRAFVYSHGGDGMERIGR